MAILTSLPFTVKELCEADHRFRVGDETREAELRGFNTNEYERWLSAKFNRTVKCIGYGYYSSVYIIEGYEGQVLKICPNSLSDRWLQYAEVVQDRFEGWFPRIDFIEVHRHFYVAVLEKLTPFVHEADAKDINDASSDEAHKLYEKIYSNLIVWPQHFKTIEQFKQHPDYINNQFINDNIRIIKAAFEVYSELDELCRKKGFVVVCDIHAGNVMMRGDTMVLTDPVIG